MIFMDLCEETMLNRLKNDLKNVVFKRFVIFIQEMEFVCHLI